ncbi:MAG: hypothetical protein RE471_08585 [Ferroplasma sp.]|uniref:hypothetical protein n=1 Tax=Ferroplasma sp. TaxID=2591003 RepID=UPI0028165582|nr:hypothetical protein [Ferroplasma sp.]WMT51021.1 MAG: hypothetical protein RE471_08585 [Ferroplasma sp.]
MKNENFFCEITKSEMGFDQDVFLYFSMMDYLTALTAEIKNLDPKYEHYDDILDIAWILPDDHYKNLKILSEIDIEKYKDYRKETPEILKKCGEASIMLYKAYSEARIALNYFVKISKDKRFEKYFNDENLVILKNLKNFYLARFYDLNI